MSINADLCTRCGQKISDVDMRIRCQHDALREWFARGASPAEGMDS
jgi:hypothetical protein